MKTEQYLNVSSVGKTVHYKMSEKSDCVAAIITAVNEDGTVCLTLFEPFKNAHVFARVPHESVNNPLLSLVGNWHWIEVHNPYTGEIMKEDQS